MNEIKEEVDVFEKMEDINYIPVITGGIINYSFNDSKKIGEKTVSFILNNSFYNYNKWLVNPFHSKESYEKVLNEGNIIDKKKRLVFADSGGLQEINLGSMKFSPEEVFLWQEKYSDIGFCLDKIPYIKKNQTWIFDEQNFIKCAYQTKENIDRALKVRTKNKEFKFYGIIQGNSPHNFEQWRKIIDCEGLDGFCCKSSYNSPLLIAKTAYYATTLNKPIHFLGMGNLSKTIILFYAKNYIKQKISFDSSSYDTGTQFRAYNLPFSFGSKEILLSGSEYLLKDFKFCGCPNCEILSKIITDKEMDRFVGPLISFHNLHLNVKIFNYLSQIYKDKEKMREFTKKFFKTRTARKILLAFDYIDDAISKGIDYADSKYTEDMFEDKKKTIQRSLF